MLKSKGDRDRVEPAVELMGDGKSDDPGVRATSRAFLQLRGRFKVGPGDPVEDVRRARALMGTEDI